MKPKQQSPVRRPTKLVSVPTAARGMLLHTDLFNETDVAAVLKAATRDLAAGCSISRVARLLNDAAQEFILWSQPATAPGEFADWMRGVEKLSAKLTAHFGDVAGAAARITPLFRRCPCEILEAGMTVYTETRLAGIIADLIELTEQARLIAAHVGPHAQGRRFVPRAELDLFAGIHAAYQEAFDRRMAISVSSATNKPSGYALLFCQTFLNRLADKLELSAKYLNSDIPPDAHVMVRQLNRPEHIAVRVRQTASDSKDKGKPFQEK